MRAIALALGIFLAATVDADAQATPFALTIPGLPDSSLSRLRLPQPDSIAYRRGFSPDDDLIGWNTHSLRFVPISRPLLSVGSFRLHLGGEGTHAHFARYDLDDAHFLNADISGTIDGRAATIRLVWPTGN